MGHENRGTETACPEEKERDMEAKLRTVAVSLCLTLTALLGLGCAQMPQSLAGKRPASMRLEARGPGAVFGSIDRAAVDALTYAYLECQAARDHERVRGGTIFRVDGGYSYGMLQVASRLAPHRIRTVLGSQDVARFLVYTRTGRRGVDRANERPSRTDRRSVTVTDPLHRPVYILHPSLVVREYRGEDHELVEVADLTRPRRDILVAGD